MSHLGRFLCHIIIENFADDGTGIDDAASQLTKRYRLISHLLEEYIVTVNNIKSNETKPSV